MSEWIKTISLADLEQKQRAIFRYQGKQIALFNTKKGIRACNNRCPHEGYPLKEGSLDNAECVLTCNWHNWAFNLDNGENLYGGDQLRIYPVKTEQDFIWIDVSEAPFQQRQQAILDNLKQAFDDHDYTRIARELARLKQLGADPVMAIKAAIEWSYQRFEFGFSHAYAGAADWLTLYDEQANDVEIQLVCLLEIIGHIADDVLREQDYPFSEAEQVYDEEQFVAAIEHKDEATAIALLRGGLTAGVGFTGLERGLSRAALSHYHDFGHSLIYVTKAGALIERLGDEVTLPLLLSLTRSIIYAWREDLIPEFRDYASALQVWGQNGRQQSPEQQAYEDLNIKKALAYTVAHSTAPAADLYQALLGANARHWLHYDMQYQFQTHQQVSDNVGWLSFTHGITFANAVRQQCQKFPDLWPQGLLQMACFSGRNKAYTDRDLEASQWAVDNHAEFMTEYVHKLFDHGCEEYIVSVHLLKTGLAVREELTHATPANQQLLTAALNRFVHSPLKRKHTQRTAHQALSFVALDG